MTVFNNSFEQLTPRQRRRMFQVMDQQSTDQNIETGASLLSAATRGSDPDSTAGVGGSIAGGAAAGAASGLPGIAVGAGVGLIGGLAGARSARKRRRAQAEAQALQNIATIKQTEGAKKQQSIQSIISGLRSALLGK